MNRTTTRPDPSGLATITPEDLADRLHVTVRGLRHWRRTGQGPAWVRMGGQIRYRVSDVENWLAESVHRPTMSPTAAQDAPETPGEAGAA